MVFFGHVGIVLGGGWLAQAASRPDRGVGRAIPRVAAAVRERFDLRWLVLGSMLPDIIDKPLMLAFPGSPVSGGRTIAHSLLFVVVLLAAGLVARSATRAALLALCIASAGHLALDQMWQMPHTLLWPALGWRFQPIDVAALVEHVINGLKTNPSTYVAEAVGAAITLAFIAHLAGARKVRGFLSTGRA